MVACGWLAPAASLVAGICVWLEGAAAVAVWVPAVPCVAATACNCSSNACKFAGKLWNGSVLPVAEALPAVLAAVLAPDAGVAKAVVLLGGGGAGVVQMLFDMFIDTMRAPDFGLRPMVRSHVQTQCQ